MSASLRVANASSTALVGLHLWPATKVGALLLTIASQESISVIWSHRFSTFEYFCETGEEQFEGAISVEAYGGTPSHFLMQPVIPLSNFSTVEIGTSKMVSDHSTRGRRPNC